MDISTETQLRRTTVHRILKVLQQEGVADQDPASRRYRLGVESYLWGIARPSPLPARSIAGSHMRRMSEACGDAVFLTVRASGFAYSEHGVMPGSRAIAVAVRDETDQPVAAVSIVSIAQRINQDRFEELLGVLREGAEHIAAELGASMRCLPEISASVEK